MYIHLNSPSKYRIYIQISVSSLHFPELQQKRKWMMELCMYLNILPIMFIVTEEKEMLFI